jgi:hypothetical protein
MAKALCLSHSAGLDIFFKSPENGKIIPFRACVSDGAIWTVKNA